MRFKIRTSILDKKGNILKHKDKDIIVTKIVEANNYNHLMELYPGTVLVMKQYKL